MTWALWALLYAGILTLWIPERAAWSFVQCGVFAIAAMRLPKMRWRLAAWVMIAASAWPLLQLVMGTTVSRGQTWLALVDWWSFAVLFVLTADLLSERGLREWFLRASAIGGGLLAVIAVAQKYSSGGEVYWLFPSGYTDDVLGPFVNRNQFAAWMELLFPAASWLAATARRARVLYGVAAVVMLSSVVASASRAGCALILLEALAVGLLLWLHKPGLARKAAGFAALAAGGIVVMGYQGLLGRLVAARSEDLRWDALRASLQMVRDHPWMGSGMGTWSLIYPRYAGFDAGVFMNQAHNDWVQWTAEGGVPLLLLMLIFAALLWKSLFRSIYGIGVAAVLLHALVDYPLQQRPALAAWFFTMAGAAYGARNSARASRDDDVLRGVRSLREGFPGGDPAGVQTPCAPGASGPLQG